VLCNGARIKPCSITSQQMLLLHPFPFWLQSVHPVQRILSIERIED